MRFPCLRLAGEAARAGGTCALHLERRKRDRRARPFLDGGLRFLEISEVIERTLDALPSQPVVTFESLYEADRLARDLAGEAVAALR